MFILCHTIIGAKLASPFIGGSPNFFRDLRSKNHDSKGGRRLNLWFVLLGTVLPDLIDKPLYYLHVLFTGREGIDIGLISGTRTIAHTALFLVILALLTLVTKKKLLAALTIGVASHLVLDHFGTFLITTLMGTQEDLASFGINSDRMIGFLFPFLGYGFPDFPYLNFTDQISIYKRAHLVLGESVALLILVLDYFKWKGSFKISKKT